MDGNDNGNIKEIRPGRTKESMRRAIEGELTEAKVKEVRTKLKRLIEELAAAKRVVALKEGEIEALFTEYADVIPE
jgi:hypothetical protein